MHHIAPALPRERCLVHRAAIQAAIDRVLTVGQFVLGPETSAFEADFARYLGTAHVIGVGSGTDAIELSLRACGIGEGHAVLTASWTATATIAAIERAGARPVLVDISPGTMTMDPEDLEKCIRDYSRVSGPPLKAIIPVHLYGHPADMSAIMRIGHEHGLRVIEDCAQSHGATWHGRMTGNWGDLAAFSFYPTKNLGAVGDAGAVATADSELANRVRLLREYGWNRERISGIAGTNSRLDELQAAILRVLLPHLAAENLQRLRVAMRYSAALNGTDIVAPCTHSGARHVFHHYVVRTEKRDVLKSFLQEHGITTQVHYPMPVHSQPAYAGRLLFARELPVTLLASGQVLSLPMSPHLPESAVEHVLATLAQWANSSSLRSAS